MPDKLGATLSFLCLIHCLVWPWLVMLTPFLAMTDDITHRWLFILLAPIAVIASVNGYAMHHQLKACLLILLGLAIVGLPVFIEMAHVPETIITVFGSLLLMAGHVFNRRMIAINNIVTESFI